MSRLLLNGFFRPKHITTRCTFVSNKLIKYMCFNKKTVVLSMMHKVTKVFICAHSEFLQNNELSNSVTSFLKKAFHGLGVTDISILIAFICDVF